MKLYIATTSLNFDTIMSTESISPASFYPQRGFGIQHMYNKVSQFLPNSILLLDFIPNYKIDNAEYDHRPLIIEVDTDNYPKDYFKKVRDNVYQTNKTIYLSPLSSSILFLKDEDYRITLNKSENIIETKTILYTNAKRIGVVNAQYTRPIQGTFFEGILDVEKIDEVSFRRDKLINKAKGFLTAYLIGRGKSLTTESARLLNITRQIKNLIYSLSTKEGTDKNRIHQELRTLVNEANHLTWILDPSKSKASASVNQDLADAGFNDDETQRIRKYFGLRGLFAPLFSKLCPELKLFSFELHIQALVNALDDQEFEKALNALTQYTLSIIQYSAGKQNISSLIEFDPDLKMIECKDDSVDKVSRKITAILYNLLSDQNIKSEVFKNNRINYIYDLGEALQNREDIDFDSIKGYINGLLDNLEHLKKFDIGSSELIALSSFAAFIKAPDADVEKLFSVVTSNELTDYRITLGLWGLIHGYSNIPNYYFKQWIEQLDNNDVLQYIDIVNKCIYGNADYATAESSTESIVQSESLTSNTPELSEPSLFLHEEQENEQTYEQAVEGKKTIKDEVNHTEKCHSQEPKIQNHISCENTSFNESFQEILQKSREILEAKKPQKKQDTFLSYYINRIEMILNTSTDFAEIIQEIEAIPAQEGKTAWNGAKVKIKKAIKEIEKSHKRKHENSIFDMPITRTDDKQKSFLADEATWGKIAAHLPNNPNLIKKLKDDFDWFRTNYYSGKYETNPKDNHSVLDHFYWFLMRKINESGYHNSYSREYRQLSPDTVERIMNTLKILYP